MFVKILATILLFAGGWMGANYLLEMMSQKSDILPIAGVVGLAVMLYIIYRILKWIYTPKESVSEEQKTETIT